MTINLKNASTRSRLSFLLKDSFVYGGASALQRAFAIITFPILARYYSVSQYGLIDYFTVLSNFLALILVFGMDSAVGRFFYEKEDKKSRISLISQALFYQIIIAFSGMILLYITVKKGIFFGDFDDEIQDILFIVIYRLPFMAIINFIQNNLKWTFRKGAFVFMSLGYVIGNLIALVLAIHFFAIQIKGLFIIHLIISALFAVIGLYLIRKWLIVPKGFSHLPALIKYAVPYGIICVINAAVPAMERHFAGQLSGDSLGLYGAGAKIAMIIHIISQSFQYAWGPFSFAIFKEKSSQDAYNWVLRLFALFSVPGVFFLTAISKIAILILASGRYEGAESVVFPLAMGYAIAGLAQIGDIGIALSKKTWLKIFGYGAQLGISWKLISLLAPRHQIMGIATAILAGQFVMAFLCMGLGQLVWPMKWKLKGPIFYFFFFAVLGIALNYGQFFHDHRALFYYLSSGLIALSAGWYLLFEPAERMRLKKALKGKKIFRYNYN